MECGQQFCKYTYFQSNDVHSMRVSTYTTQHDSIRPHQYTLLTGVYPMYNECKDSRVRARIKEGEIPYIDPRWTEKSFAEGELARITALCFAYDPKDRPSMSELVRQLRIAVAQNKNEGREE